MTTDASALGRFFTIAETAEMLNVSVGDVDELIRTGELPAIQVRPGLWRIEDVHIEAYIALKYEENDFRLRWQGAQYADVAELAGVPRDRRPR